MPLFALSDDDEPAPALPVMTGQQEVFADYRTAGLSLKAHPISFFRPQLDTLGIATASRLGDLVDGRFVPVGGLVLVRQRPSTAKGITFVTLEDETGTANLIIKIDVWERYYQVAHTATALLATGRLQNQKGVVHVLVSKLDDLTTLIGQMRSRDFSLAWFVKNEKADAQRRGAHREREKSKKRRRRGSTTRKDSRNDAKDEGKCGVRVENEIARDSITNDSLSVFSLAP